MDVQNNQNGSSVEAILSAKLDKIVISTGNVLSVNKKTGQKPTDELLECLKLTIDESDFIESQQQLQRTNDDLAEKMNEHQRNEIKVGAKIFLNNNSVEYLNEAVIAVLKILNVDCLDSLILAYHPIEKNAKDSPVMMNGGSVENVVKEDGHFEWGSKNDDAMNNLKALWKHLETFPKGERICQLGVADLDVDSLMELHSSAVVPPTIAQINLSACCVVPPPLQEFCTKNDIPLLTHSDPTVLLDAKSLEQTFGLKGYEVTWAARYQVHVKCRGLLTVKGFVVGAKRK